jgi:hypothetical protein
MPRGPKGEKRPADVIGNAVHVMRVAIGEIEDVRPTPESEGKKEFQTETLPVLGGVTHRDRGALRGAQASEVPADRARA